MLCVFLTYICSCFQNHTFHSLFSFCHSLWESWVCGAHGCWLTPQHLFPSLIPIWSSAVPGTPTPRDSTFCSISCCVCFGLSFIFTVECWGFQGLLSSARSGPHYPNLISFSSAHGFHHLPPSSSASSLFLEYAGEVPTLPPSISLNKTCEGPDGVEHFSLNPSFFFHTERTFQQNQINFKHSLLNASRGVCTNILPWQEFWRMCIEPFFLGSERTMCNSVVEKALLKAIEGGIYWVGFQILLHLQNVSCSAVVT